MFTIGSSPFFLVFSRPPYVPNGGVEAATDRHAHATEPTQHAGHVEDFR
jgi:hypothetical protein